MSDPLFSGNFVVGKSPTGSNSGVGRATKKVRRRMETTPDTDDSIVNANGQTIGEVGVNRISYKSMLMGNQQDTSIPNKLEEDFDL